MRWIIAVLLAFSFVVRAEAEKPPAPPPGWGEDPPKSPLPEVSNTLAKTKQKTEPTEQELLDKLNSLPVIHGPRRIDKKETADQRKKREADEAKVETQRTQIQAQIDALRVKTAVKQKAEQATLQLSIDALREQVSQNSSFEISQKDLDGFREAKIYFNPFDAEASKVGLLPAFKVLQVIDENSMLINIGDATFYLEVPTNGFADDHRYQPKESSVVRIHGTQSYTTVLGAKKTVYRLVALSVK